MQIHELNSFVGTPSSTDYLAIDDGNTTTKVPATSLGVSTAMTQAEAEAGTITSLKVISPSVFKSAVLAIARTIADKWLPQSVVHIVEAGTSDGWTYRKWSDGKMEAWRDSWGSTGSFTAWGSLFYRDIDGPSIPSGMFNVAPVAFVTPVGSQAAVFGVYSVTTAKVGKIRFIHNNVNTEAAYANIYLLGTWR